MLESVVVPVDGASLLGDLAVPREAKGLVVFAHGSGSSRLSPRNRFVARRLREAGLATFLVDLLTAEEEAVDSASGRLRFDIDLLAGRLERVTGTLGDRPDCGGLRQGYFGASTGAAAALVAAADRDAFAVVSRGGRPDLAPRSALERVRAPTLLIVGGEDRAVLGVNREAAAVMRCEVRLEVVPWATHLFQEPGALETVAALAAGWFTTRLEAAVPDPPFAPFRVFRDRVDAGNRLAEALGAYRDRPDAVVAAIPRGGVVVGARVAKALHLDLDVVLTKKIGHPSQPEYAIGVVSLATEEIDQEAAREESIPPEYIRAEVDRLRRLLRERQETYRAGRPPTAFAGKTALLVDDGVATGQTMLSAVRLLRREGAKRIVVAAPVASPRTAARLRTEADEVVCLLEPELFFAIGQFYEDFTQVTDEEAIRLLSEAKR